jgi:ABC-type polysaccharide/polyol phosphate export permease
MGVGFILSTASVYFADMLPVYDVILTIWLYATPIIYPLEIVPESWLWLFRLNPLYYLVELFRFPLLNGVIPSYEIWIPAILSAFLTLMVGGLVFTSRASDYAYHL